jgi:hypothetical protein
MTLGADAMAAACLQIENAAGRGGAADLADLVDQLRVEFDRIWPAMAARTGGLEY